ncbi:VOC family protein [Brevundimonas goettingensis]|uniref:VOC family protein n=2 Tax=Brevundimonas goettingensis TaxID=2774190 RepID=A0A975C3F7_9CAUL|nr:VOC family protein [Brevundimonas goettingensis]
MSFCKLGAAVFLVALACQAPVMAEAPGHVTGIGGVFVKSKDPAALADWYREALGVDVAAWGGAVLRYTEASHPPAVSWMAVPETSDHMAPSTREFMINLTVDDMDAMVERLRSADVPILDRNDDDAFGRFVWIQDPDGTKIELWQPR